MAKLDRFIGHPVLDCDGTRIGILDDFYRDDRTGRTLWLKVRTGWFGRHSRFVTVDGSKPCGENLVLGVDHHMVTNAPVTGRAGPLSLSEDAELKAYYATRVAGKARRANTVPGGLIELPQSSRRQTSDRRTERSD